MDKATAQCTTMTSCVTAKDWQCLSQQNPTFKSSSPKESIPLPKWRIILAMHWSLEYTGRIQKTGSWLQFMQWTSSQQWRMTRQRPGSRGKIQASSPAQALNYPDKDGWRPAWRMANHIRLDQFLFLCLFFLLVTQTWPSIGQLTLWGLDSCHRP